MVDEDAAPAEEARPASPSWRRELDAVYGDAAPHAPGLRAAARRRRALRHPPARTWRRSSTAAPWTSRKRATRPGRSCAPTAIAWPRRSASCASRSSATRRRRRRCASTRSISASRCSSPTSCATSPRTRARGRIYLPADELRAFGVSRSGSAVGHALAGVRAPDAVPGGSARARTTCAPAPPSAVASGRSWWSPRSWATSTTRCSSRSRRASSTFRRQDHGAPPRQDAHRPRQLRQGAVAPADRARVTARCVKHVVVIGGGFAGLAAATRSSKRARRDAAGKRGSSAGAPTPSSTRRPATSWTTGSTCSWAATGHARVPRAHRHRRQAAPAGAARVAFVDARRGRARGWRRRGCPGRCRCSAGLFGFSSLPWRDKLGDAQGRHRDPAAVALPAAGDRLGDRRRLARPARPVAGGAARLLPSAGAGHAQRRSAHGRADARGGAARGLLCRAGRRRGRAHRAGARRAVRPLRRRRARLAAGAQRHGAARRGGGARARRGSDGSGWRAAWRCAAARRIAADAVIAACPPPRWCRSSTPSTARARPGGPASAADRVANRVAAPVARSPRHRRGDHRLHRLAAALDLRPQQARAGADPSKSHLSLVVSAAAALVDRAADEIVQTLVAELGRVRARGGAGARACTRGVIEGARGDHRARRRVRRAAPALPEPGRGAVRRRRLRAHRAARHDRERGARRRRRRGVGAGVRSAAPRADGGVGAGRRLRAR